METSNVDILLRLRQLNKSWELTQFCLQAFADVRLIQTASRLVQLIWILIVRAEDETGLKFPSSQRTVDLSIRAHAVLFQWLCGVGRTWDPAKPRRTQCLLNMLAVLLDTRDPVGGCLESPLGNRSVSILCWSWCVLDVENLF